MVAKRLLLGLGLILAAAPARADLTIETKHGEETIQTLVSEHKMSVRTPAEKGNMIFRGDRKVLWIIDSGENSYQEMTEKDAQQLGGQMQDAMAKMKEALAKVPPEQRAAVEKMMAGKMGGAGESKRIVTPLGQSRKINDFLCAGYRVEIDRGGEMEVWSTDPKGIKVTEKDLTVFKEFAEFMKALNPGGMESLEGFLKDFDHPKEGEVPGLPILTIMKDKEGKEKWRSEVVRIAPDAIPAASFELPPGLKKEKLGLGQ